MVEKLVKEAEEIVGKEEEEIPYRRSRLESSTVSDGDWLNEGGHSGKKSKTWYNPTNDKRKTIEGPRVTLEYKHVIESNVTTNTISDTLNEYAAAGWSVEHMSYGFGGVPLGAAILFKREKFS